MSAFKAQYAGAVSMTITLANLADSTNVGRESAAESNTSNLYLDALISARFKTANSGTISAPSAVFLYAAAAIDGGTDYPDAVTGADAGITLQSPTQLKLLGAVYFTAINASVKGGPWSLAALYGGRMPEKWSIVVINDSGTALSATGTDHFVKYQGMNVQSV